MAEKVKVYARIRPEDAKELKRLANEFSVTQSGMIAIVVNIGLNYLKAVTNPESLLSAEKMAEIMIEAEKRGVEFKVPEELKDK